MYVKYTPVVGFCIYSSCSLLRGLHPTQGLYNILGHVRQVHSRRGFLYFFVLLASPWSISHV